MEIVKVPSNHTTGKKNTKQFIVIHHTGLGDFNNILKWLSNVPKSIKYSRVSAHYLIDVSGKIYQIIPDDEDSWHAGSSKGVVHVGSTKTYKTVEVSDLNNKSIGIELHGDGNLIDYSDEQYASLIELCKSLREKYNIDPRNILGHEDISPTRKRDPGSFFDWVRLFKGLYA